MARQEVDIGVEGNDGTGDSIRESFRKVNENFREIYAVVGKGGQITFTLLSDTPDDLAPFAGDGNTAYIPIVSNDGTEIEIRRIGSNELDETDTALDTIDIKVSQDGAIILKTKGVDIQLDKTPVLGGPLNASGTAIGNVGTTQDDVNLYNDTHNAALTLDDIVIDKKFADSNYIRRQLPGENVLISPEPIAVNFYERTINEIVGNGFITITSHGFTTGSNGKEFKIKTEGPGFAWSYVRRVGGQPIEDTSDDTGLAPLGDGDSVFIKVIDENTLAFYLEYDYVFEENTTTLEELRLKITRENQNTDIIQIVDADYDSELEGLFSSSQAVPRKNVVRRQGDTMEGALILHDHPGDLAGRGSPNGITDLQAVTKLYVDSQSTESSTNIYVSTVGNDDQSVAPPGKEGSSLAYAYRTVGAAARKAEEIQISSPFEPGPYMQDLIYSVLQEDAPAEVNLSQVTDFAVNDNDVGVLRRTNAKALIDANIEFIIAETIEWYKRNIANSQTTSVGIAVGAGNITYDINWTNRVLNDRLVETEIKNSVNAGLLDLLSGTTATTVSTQVALEFFNTQYVKAQNGITREVYIAILNKVRTISDIVLNNDTNTPYTDSETGAPLQTAYPQVFIPFAANDPTDTDIGAFASTNGSISLQMGIIGVGPLSIREDSVIRDRAFTPNARFILEFDNGTNDFVDQGNPSNTDIRTGKVLRGKTSGALGRVVSYEQGGSTSDDIVQMEMLNSKSFILGENIELGNAVNERQITIHVETGQYEEDYPIRLPAQTSLVGNEMRRTIIRPKKRVSQSPWSGVYFYRDREFDGLTGDDTSVTGIPDNNIPSSGTPYTDPLTGELAGYFGRHYLYDPSIRKNVYGENDINKYDNPGNYTNAAVLIERNRDYIVEEVIARITYQLSINNNDYLVLTGWGNQGDPKQDRYRRQFKNVLDLVALDLRDGGDLGVLEAQGNLFFGLKDFPGEEVVVDQSLSYIYNILKKVLVNDDFVRDSNIVFPAAGGDQYINENLVVAEELLDVITTQLEKGIVTRQFDLLRFVTNEDYNPAKRSTDVDVFLMNDATIVRQLSVQGHGGFMTVLDPEGQILTKSPYIQTGSSFSQSVNRQAFRGGMLVDAFCANTTMKVVSLGDSSLTLPNYLVLNVEGEIGDGLSERKPRTPAPFYIDGVRFQVNDIINYEPGDEFAVPRATLILDANSGPKDINGQSLGWTLTIPPGGFAITVQTAGNRSQLGNDFTQVNDLGYGLVTINGGISEMVSMFTYYCWGAYYAGNGGQIRSTTGSNCNGVYGLIAEGSDPNEVPDAVLLENDMVQSAKSFSAQLVLEVPSAVSLSATPTADIVSNSASNPTGYGRTVFSSNGKKVYLTDVRGTFTQGDTLFTGITFTDYEDPQTGTGGTTTGVSVDTVDSTGYINEAEQLSMYVYDAEYPPEAKGEITFLHPTKLARYEIASVQKEDGIVVDGYTIDSTEYTFGATTRDTVTVDGQQVTEPTPNPASEATIVITKSALNGGKYNATIFGDEAGNNYKVGDTFTVLGGQLNGTDGVHDAVVTVETISRTATNIQNDIFTGIIVSLSVSGSPNVVNDYTPQRDGQVYKLNFSTSNDKFDNDGLESAIPIDQYVGIRQNANHIFKDVGNIDTLTIRPSTAINFQDDPEDTYRSISFGRNDSVGNALLDTETLTGFDSGYDYVRLVVNDDHIQRLGGNLNPQIFAGVTLGSTVGDSTIAIELIPEVRDRWRLNNNLETDQTYRPDTIDYLDGLNNQFDYTAELPKVFTWQGKKHYVFNYREVVFNDGLNTFDQTSQFDEANSFALVDIKKIKEVTLTLSKNATWNRLAGSGTGLRAAVVRQAGNTSAYGKVKISGKETNEISLYDIEGTFNTTGQLEISYNTSTQDFEDADFTDSNWEDLTTPGSVGGAVPTAISIRDTDLTDTNYDGIAASLATGTTDTNILRAGLQDGSPATITINISTCRATGHDFLDIGTGGYNTTNYPNVILGIPAAIPQQENEVQERNKGRVFYMSTDQDGFFRVGRFFTVDQGTGTVSFAASIALSDVDGIGFKRGVVVTEFSSDSSMADNAIDSVPVESAVRGYVNRRLGYDQNGNVVNNPLGPSVITQNGAVAFTGDQSMGGNRLYQLAPINLDTSGDRDAVPKDYVDSRSEAYNAMTNLRDVSTFAADQHELLGFSNSKKAYFKDFSQGADFTPGRVLTDSALVSYYGLILGRIETYDPQYGNVVIVTFQPGPDELTQVTPFGYANGEVVVQTTATVFSGAPTFDAQGNLTSITGSNPSSTAEMISGPFNEVINISEEPFRDGVPTSDIRFTTRRLEDDTNFNSFRGEWDNATVYSVGNIVEYSNDPDMTKSLYQLAQPNAPAGTLPTDNTFWNAYTDTVREEPTAYIEFQINPEVIVDADVNPDAEIQQSKLLMQEADVYVENAADVETIPAVEIVSGIEYEIVTSGDTDFTTVGAADNNETTTFIATDDGISAVFGGTTGTVKRVLTTTSTAGLVDNGDRDVQAQLGLSKFDGANFKVTRGHVQIKDNGITLDKIQKLATDTVIGNSTASTATPTEVTFSDVVDQGFGIQHSDLPFTDSDGTEDTNDVSSAGVLTRIAADDYTVVPATISGTKNSFVKTSNAGQITALSFALNAGSNEILAPTGTSGLEFKNPKGGTILTAEYNSSEEDPVIYTPASVNLGTLQDGSDTFDESTIHAASGATETPWVASNWAYHAFIESPSEKGAASTGIAIGAGSGKANAGEVAIVVANSSNSTSPVAATFSSTGLSLTGALSASGALSGASLSVTGAISAGTSASVGTSLTVGTSATFGGGYNSTGVSISSAGAISMNGALTIDGNIAAGGTSQDIGSSSSPFRDIYGSTFSGTAATAKFADLAEMYVADADYEPGTVLVFGGDYEVTVCSSKGDTRIAGVVSTDPAYLMNSHQQGDNVVAVALTGRVPCKVIGKVRKGDILVTSAVPGYAIVNNTPAVGTVIGKAIENKDTDDKGVIEVVVGRV